MANSSEKFANRVEHGAELPNNPEIVRGEVPLVVGLKGFENGQEIRKEVPQDVKIKDVEHGHLAVFDGVSTSVGEEASNRAALESARYLGSYLDQKVESAKKRGEDVGEVVIDTIKESFRAAQENIDQFTKSLDGTKEAGSKAQTTGAVLRFVEGKAYFASIGDSEIWRYRDGKLELLNQFDSSGTSLYEMGQITAEQTELFNRSNNLESLKELLLKLEQEDPEGQKFPAETALLVWNNTSQVLSECIGTESGKKVSDVPVGVEELQDGDVYLVASDGNVLSKERIREIIETGEGKSDDQLEQQIQDEADYISSSKFKGTKAHEEFGGRHPLAKPDDIAAVLHRYKEKELPAGRSEKNQYPEKNKAFESELTSLSEEEAADLRDSYLQNLEEMDEEIIDVEIDIASVKDDLDRVQGEERRVLQSKLAGFQIDLAELQAKGKEFEYKSRALRLEVIEPGLKRTVDKVSRDISPFLTVDQEVVIDGEPARILGVSPDKREYFTKKVSEEGDPSLAFVKRNRFEIEADNFPENYSSIDQDRIRNAVEPLDIVLKTEHLKSEWESAENKLLQALQQEKALLRQIEKERAADTPEAKERLAELQKNREGAMIHDQVEIKAHLQAMEARDVERQAFDLTQGQSKVRISADAKKRAQGDSGAVEQEDIVGGKKGGFFSKLGKRLFGK